MVFQQTDDKYLKNVVNIAYIINILHQRHKWHYEFLNVNLISQLVLKSVILLLFNKKNNWKPHCLLCLSINDRVSLLVMVQPWCMQVRYAFALKSIETVSQHLHLFKQIAGTIYDCRSWAVAQVQNDPCPHHSNHLHLQNKVAGS